MFRRVRLGLTALYIFAALALMVLFGAGAYYVLDDYFRSTTDLALRHTMAEQWHVLGLPLPPDLAQADREWSAGYGAHGNLLDTPTVPVGTDEGEQTGSPEAQGGYGVEQEE